MSLRHGATKIAGSGAQGFQGNPGIQGAQGIIGGPGPMAAAGIMVPFAGSSAPSGWALCFGQAVLRSTYAALFTAIGTTYGAGDGSTTFNLPDMRGRVAVGLDNIGGTSSARLSTYVSATTASGSTTVTVNTSGISIGMHVSGASVQSSTTVTAIASGTSLTLSTQATATGTNQLRFYAMDGESIGSAGGEFTHNVTSDEMPSHTHVLTPLAYGDGKTYSIHSGTAGGGTGYTQASGGFAAHNNMQPSLVLNWIISIGSSS